jgi:hypothetical protein
VLSQPPDFEYVAKWQVCSIRWTIDICASISYLTNQLTGFYVNCISAHSGSVHPDCSYFVLLSIGFFGRVQPFTQPTGSLAALRAGKLEQLLVMIFSNFRKSLVREKD